MHPLHTARWVALLSTLSVLNGPANAQTLIWDNESGRFLTAASNTSIFVRRSLLDDFTLGQPAIMTDFSMLYLWDSGEMGFGERVELTLWSDDGDMPGEPVRTMNLLAFEEVFTGEIQFGRRMMDLRQQVEPLILGTARTWIDMLTVGSESGWQMMTFVTGEPGWTCYEDFPPCPRPGIDVFGFDTDFSFKLFGFIPGQANEGFIRTIAPLLFSGDPEGTVQDVRESDDQYYMLTAGPGIHVRRPSSAIVIFETTLPSFPLDRMDLRLESIGTADGVQQAVALFDYVAQRWVLLDNQPLPFTGDDLVVLVEDIANPQRFISEADGKSQVRVEAYSRRPQAQPHQLKVDKVNFVLTYTP